MKIQDFEVSERRLRRFCRFLASNKAISFETLEHQLNQLQCKSSRGLVSPFGVAAVENLGLILLKTRSTMVLSSEEEVVQVLADWRKKTDRVFNDSGWEVFRAVAINNLRAQKVGVSNLEGLIEYEIDLVFDLHHGERFGKKFDLRDVFQGQFLDKPDSKSLFEDLSKDYGVLTYPRILFCVDVFKSILLKLGVFQDKGRLISARSISENVIFASIVLDKPVPLEGAFFRSPKLSLETQNAIIDWLCGHEVGSYVSFYAHAKGSSWFLNRNSLQYNLPIGGEFKLVVDDLQRAGILEIDKRLVTNDADVIRRRLSSFMSTGLTVAHNRDSLADFDVERSREVKINHVRRLNERWMRNSWVSVPEMGTPNEILHYLVECKFNPTRKVTVGAVMSLVKYVAAPIMAMFVFPVIGFIGLVVQVVRFWKNEWVLSAKERDDVVQGLGRMVDFVPVVGVSGQLR